MDGPCPDLCGEVFPGLTPLAIQPGAIPTVHYGPKNSGYGGRIFAGQHTDNAMAIYIRILSYGAVECLQDGLCCCCIMTNVNDNPGVI